MISVVTATEPRDLPELATFLTRIYRLTDSHPLADPALLEWKYFWPRSDWSGSRSYVIKKHGRIVAHCGACPVTFCLPDGSAVQSLTMTDWAADPSSPGAGIMPFRKLMGMVRASFAVGAIATLQIVLGLGFRQEGEALTYSAWLRPWREFRARPLTLRSALRTLHGWTHPVRDANDVDEHWEFTRVAEFDSSLHPVLSPANRPWTTCGRTLADLNYLLKYPYLEMEAFVLLRRGELAGYFIVGKADWEARVLDLRVGSENANDWKGACSVMTKAIGLDPGIGRVRILASVPMLQRALLSNGYWCQFREPIFVHDRSHVLDRAFPVGLQFFDGDSGF